MSQRNKKKHRYHILRSHFFFFNTVKGKDKTFLSLKNEKQFHLVSKTDKKCPTKTKLLKSVRQKVLLSLAKNSKDKVIFNGENFVSK